MTRTRTSTILRCLAPTDECGWWVFATDDRVADNEQCPDCGGPVRLSAVDDS